MSDLSDLLARIEAAEAPDRLLFLTLAGALLEDPYLGGTKWLDTFAKLLNAEAWTDAALALVERALPGWVWSLGNLTKGGQAYLMCGPNAALIGGPGKTPALALLAAMLKALIAKDAP